MRSEKGSAEVVALVGFLLVLGGIIGGAVEALAEVAAQGGADAKK